MQIYLYAVGFLFIYYGLLSIIIVVVVVTLVAVCFVCLLSSNGLKPLNKCKKKKGKQPTKMREKNSLKLS